MDAYVDGQMLVVRQIQAELRADAARERLAAEGRRLEALRRPEERARGLRWRATQLALPAWAGRAWRNRTTPE